MKSKNALDAAIRDRLSARRNFRHGLLFLAACLLLCPLVAPMLIAGTGAPESGVMAASILPFLGMAGPLREADGGNPDGGGGSNADDNLDPEAKAILKKIAETKAEMEEINKTLGDHEETKKQVEELHKSIRSFDGLESDIKAVMEKSAKLEKRLAEVRREVSGDPLKRLSEDEEMRSLVVSDAKKAYLVKHNKPVSKEIEASAERMRSILEGKALLGGSAPGAAYIDTEMMSTVYQLVANYGRWADFDVYRPGARTVKVPVDTTDPSMAWMTEGTPPSEASYNGSSVTLNIKDAYGWVGVSNSLLEDDEIGLARHLAQKFARATSQRLDHAIFASDGTDDATHGDFEGLFEFGTAFDMPNTKDAVADAVFGDFVNLLAGADSALLEAPTSRWWVHPTILVKFLLIKDTNGRPLFLTGLEAPSASGIGSILGYPLITTNAAPSTDAPESPIAVFGDSQGLAVAVRKDMEFAASTEALFTANKTVFRQICRAGVKIKQATAFEVLTLGQTAA